MFEKKCLIFYYCSSPLHMGAGSAIGAIDNPIQREIHNNHPIINGSGAKGAVRHHLSQLWDVKHRNLLKELFGSDPGGDPNAGAVSFTDANLVAFPIRSIKNTFIYAGSPYTLARLKRTAQAAGIDVPWTVPSVNSGDIKSATLSACEQVNGQQKLFLETFEFNATVEPTMVGIAGWISKNCLPDTKENEFFKEKIKTDFFVMHDDDFNFFVKHSTLVEPHVRIDDITGTAADGALFYTENLPPESILAGLLLTSIERTPGKNPSERRLSGDALKILTSGTGDVEGLNGKIVQMGGDSTTGRGQVIINSIMGR